MFGGEQLMFCGVQMMFGGVLMMFGASLRGTKQSRKLRCSAAAVPPSRYIFWLSLQ
jgi:hypothetical protein